MNWLEHTTVILGALCHVSSVDGCLVVHIAALALLEGYP